MTDWQALDARIARKVMGWVKWNDIPEAGRDQIRKLDVQIDYEKHGFTASEYEDFCLATHRAFWWNHDEAGWLHAEEIRDWQPHKDVAQVLKVLEALSLQGVNYRTHRMAKHNVTVQLWGYVHGRFVRPLRMGASLCETICLVVEAWLDAQELPSG